MHSLYFLHFQIVKAINYLANPSLPFLATNEDAVFPGPEPGMLIPGAGIVSLKKLNSYFNNLKGIISASLCFGS